MNSLPGLQGEHRVASLGWELVYAGPRLVTRALPPQCCGQPLDLSGALSGVAVLNIPSMHGGSNLWGETKKPLGEARNRATGSQPEAVTDPETLKTCVQGAELGGGACMQGAGPGVGAGVPWGQVGGR